jgi:hypothetical protein
VKAVVEYVVDKGHSSPARRLTMLSIGCLAVALFQSPCAYATPLSSDVPRSAPAALQPAAAPATIGISLWSYVHPGSADANETAIETQAAVPIADYSGPRWVATTADEPSVDQSTDSDDTFASVPGGATSARKLFSSATSRSSRYSSGGARSSRPDSETYTASVSARAVSVKRSLCGYAERAADCAGSIYPARLFRPPRA